MYRRIIFFLVIFSLWFFGNIFWPFDAGFYQSLNTPSFIPVKMFISIIWIVIYFLNTLSFYKSFKDFDLNNDYYFIIILNYLFNQLFSLFFFYFNNLFLGLISCIVIFVSTTFWFLETKKIDKTSAYLLLPYIIWSFLALNLSICIFVIN